MDKNSKKRYPPEAYFVAIVSFIASIIMMAQVIGRYAFGNSISWSEEAVRYLFIWVTMVGAGYATRENANISIDFVEGFLKNRTAKFIFKCVGIVIFMVCAIYLVYQSTQYCLFTFKTGSRSTVLQVKLGYIYASLPVGFAVVAIRLALNGVKAVRNYIRHEGEFADEMEVAE